MLSVDLLRKINEAKNTIIEVMKNKENVYISDSGGVDSAVISHLTKSIYPDTISHFFNTGVENKENLKLMKERKKVDNIKFHTPNMTYKEICYEYGFPLGGKELAISANEIINILENGISKNNISLMFKRFTGANKFGMYTEDLRLKFAQSLYLYTIIKERLPITAKCCNILKKDIAHSIKGYAITGELSEESNLRATHIKKGLIKDKKCTPIGNWTKKDVWDYINYHNIKVSKAYNTQTRTGCISCYMGVHIELKKTGIDRVERDLKGAYPKQYDKHMNYTHKTGVTFEQVKNRFMEVTLTPDRLAQHKVKLAYIKLLERKLKEFNITYNKDVIEYHINSSERIIKKLTKKTTQYKLLF